MKRLILASSSKSRRDLLAQAGLEFSVEPSAYEEDMTIKLPPKKLAIRLSQGKARDVAARHKNGLVIGCDSFGVFRGKPIGKPHTQKEAKEMLRILNGQTHDFITGITVIDCASGREISDVVASKVSIRKLTDNDIDAYLKNESVVNTNAAAYDIQRRGILLVAKIDGDYSNVVGLPQPKLTQNLEGLAIHLH